MAKFRNINKSLDRCYKQSARLALDVEEMRWIIFSDHHRGRRDGADDFLICEENYIAALEHYKQEGYTLCLLGDVEEFWENPFLSVMLKYKNVLQLEKEFYDKKRLFRIWGNHDDAWKFASTIRKHLGWLFPNISVYESIVLQIKSKDHTLGEILLVHGHQGSAESDRFSAISKVFVKYIWRNVQRLFKIPLSTPANNLKLKSQHDKAMYQWADKNQVTLICGHTHQPVFISMTHEEKMLQEIELLQKKIVAESEDNETKEKMDLLMRKVKNYMDENPSPAQLEKKKPLYFNSGCCSYSDGDITGIEMADGYIRLVKWDNKTKIKITLEETPLSSIWNQNG